MTILLLSILVILVVGYFSLFAYAFIKITRVSKEIQAFLRPTAPDQPSPFAQVVDAISANLARTIVAQAKVTFMGMQSGQARAEKQIMGDLVEDKISQSSPLLSGLLASFPALSKTLRKNPALLDLAMSKLAGKSQVSAAPGNGDKPKFNL